MGVNVKRYKAVASSVILVGILSVLWYGLYRNGLFFSPTRTVVSTYALLFGVGGLTYLWATGSIRKIPAWVALIWSYGTYTILSSLWAANSELAVGTSVVVMSGVLLATLTAYLSGVARRVLMGVTIATGPVAYLYGMFANAGWVHAKQAVEGTMMDSVFQYHNTFGAFELSIAAMATMLASTESKRYQKLYYLLCAVFSFVGVAQSFSRWVWILAVITLVSNLAVMFMLKRGRTYFLTCGTVLLVALLAIPFSMVSVKYSSVAYLIYTILVALVGVGVLSLASYILSRLQNSITKRVTVLSTIAVVVVGLIGTLVKESAKLHPVLNRIHSISFHDHSLTQRFWYYGAGLHMWLHSFFFGSGGGAWAAKFQLFEQYPYWTTMTHSIFIDQLVNFGLIGTVLWLSLITVVFKNVFASVKRSSDTAWILNVVALVGASIVLLHALFDFDMDYPAILWLFFILLGLSNPVVTSADEQVSSSVLWPKVSGVTVASVALILAGTLANSEVQVQRAQSSTNMNTQIQLYNEAVRWAPYNANAHAQLATLYFNRFQSLHSPADNEAAWKQAVIATSHAGWDPNIQDAMARVAYGSQHNQQAYDWSAKAFKDGRFKTNYLEDYMAIALWSGVAEYKQNQADATQVFQSVAQALTYAQSNEQEISALPKGQPPEWAYTVTSPMKIYAAAADYCLGQYQTSLNEMQNLSPGTDSYTMQLFNVIYKLDQDRINHIPTPVGQVAFGDQTITKEYNALAQVGD